MKIKETCLILLAAFLCQCKAEEENKIILPLDAVEELSVSAADTHSITLQWNAPRDNRYTGVRIRCERNGKIELDTLFLSTETTCSLPGMRYRAYRPYTIQVESLGKGDLQGAPATLQANCAKTPAFETSFLQHWLFLNWDDARWQQEIADLQEVGIHSIVIVPTAQREADGRYQAIYPSQLSELTSAQNDALDCCLRNCQAQGMEVYVGLNFDPKWWGSYTEEWLLKEMELSTQMMAEIEQRYGSLYPDALHGWYWAWEVDNINSTSQEKRQRIADALSVVVDYRNAAADPRPLLLCPFMNPRVGNALDYQSFWTYVFSQVAFRSGDIFAPQDCIGTAKLKLQQLPQWFGALQQAVQTKPGLQFWVDTEIFTESDWSSAPVERVVQQMEAVLPYVEGYLSFAYSHYYAPSIGKTQYHEAYKAYLKDTLGWEIPPLSAEKE